MAGKGKIECPPHDSIRVLYECVKVINLVTIAKRSAGRCRMSASCGPDGKGYSETLLSAAVNQASLLSPIMGGWRKEEGKACAGTAVAIKGG